jgi:predicted permease
MKRDDELDDEFQAHIDIEAKRLMDEGLSREVAMAEARRTFGSRAFVAERTREEWGWAWLGGVWQDLRYAVRSARRAPGFSAAAVLSLALGIGAATVVFSVADTVYLRPLPYRAPDELMWVGMKLDGLEFVLSPDYVTWRRDNAVFAQMGAMQSSGGRVAILGKTDPVEIRTTRVSYNFLTTLGVEPELGRNFEPQEELPNGPPVVLLTDALWRNHFGARPDMVGQTITMDGQDYRVVGVLPPSFVMPLGVPSDILSTLPVSPTVRHGDAGMAIWSVFARLKPGVTRAQAFADLQALFAVSKADAPQMFRNDSYVMMQPLRQRMSGNVSTLVLVLASAVACLLSIACANVANLMLARWSARSQELAVRAAIGAGRARLVRQLITETAMLCAAGCVLGLAMVAAGLRAFVYFAAGSLPRLNEAATDGRVFAIALLVSLVTLLLFGVAPALRVGRVDVQTWLQSGGRAGMSSGYRFTRRALVAGEVALSVVLLSGAALLLETLWRMQHDRLGFAPEHVMSVSMPLRPAQQQTANRRALTLQMLGEIQRVPGTVAASWSECTPLTGGPVGTMFTRSDRPLPHPWDRGELHSECAAGGDYFEAAGVRLVRGRVFTDADYDHLSTVAIVNEALARRYFPGEEPIGHQISGGRRGGWKTVVGVVADSKNQGLNQPTLPQVFLNNFALYSGSAMTFVVRRVGSEQMFTSTVRAKLKEIDPGMLAKFETLDEAIGRMSAGQRFNGVLVGSFAAVAFLMAVVGVYGVLAFAVAQRRQEIGIRVALGAGPRNVQAMVLREGALLVGVGVILGLAGALAAARSLKTLLYGVTATDPSTYAFVVVAIAVAAMLASWLPARTASQVDPATLLKQSPGGAARG